MADNTELWTQFFQKVQEDERLLQNAYPKILGVAQAGNVPAIVLQNYELARQDVQQRMAFTRDLLRQYADPQTGQTTPEPNWLPALGTINPGQPIQGITLGDALDNLRALAPMTPVSGSQIVVSAPPPAAVTQTQAGDQLGNPIIIIAVIGLLIVVTGITAKMVIDAANEKQVNLAKAAAQLEEQKNFARIWDTAQKLLNQCIGAAPTPDVILKCWDSVAQRFPDIAKSIPKVDMATAGLGFFGKLTVAAVGVGVVVAGVWAYRKWGRRGAAGGGTQHELHPRRSGGRAPSAQGTWMNGADAELAMARPEPPKRGYGAPPPRKSHKRASARR